VLPLPSLTIWRARIAPIGPGLLKPRPGAKRSQRQGRRHHRSEQRHWRGDRAGARCTGRGGGARRPAHRPAQGTGRTDPRLGRPRGGAARGCHPACGPRAAGRHGVERFERLDVLVSNAGIARTGLVAELDVDSWDAMIDVNLGGVLHGIAAALPVFRRQGHGHLVTTVSTSGLKIVPTQAVYARYWRRCARSPPTASCARPRSRPATGPATGSARPAAGTRRAGRRDRRHHHPATTAGSMRPLKNCSTGARPQARYAMTSTQPTSSCCSARCRGCLRRSGTHGRARWSRSSSTACAAAVCSRVHAPATVSKRRRGCGCLHVHGLDRCVLCRCCCGRGRGCGRGWRG
jgi:short chain dehydrogenase